MERDGEEIHKRNCIVRHERNCSTFNEHKSKLYIKTRLKENSIKLNELFEMYVDQMCRQRSGETFLRYKLIVVVNQGLHVLEDDCQL